MRAVAGNIVRYETDPITGVIEYFTVGSERLPIGAKPLPLTVNQPSLLMAFNDAANFTISGTGATKTNSTDSMLSPGAITIGCNPAASSTANMDRTSLTLSLVGYDCIELHHHVTDKSKLSGLVLFLSNDAAGGFTNYGKADFRNATTYQVLDNGWCISRMRIADLQPFGTFSAASAIRTIRVQVTSNAAGGALDVDSLWLLNAASPKIVPIFDDGFAAAYDYNGGYGFYKYLRGKGLRGTVAVIGSLVGTTGYVTHAQLREMYDYGMDLVPHGVGYGSANTNLTQFADVPTAVANVLLNQRFLVAMGFTRGADLYTLPQGAFSEALLTGLQNAGFVACRGTYEGMAVRELASRNYLMKIPGFDIGNRAAAQITPYLDAVKAIGGSAFIYGHKVGAVADSMTIAQAEFTAVIDYAIAQGFEFQTFSQYVANSGGSRVARL